MPKFHTRRSRKPVLARGVFTIQRGIGFLQVNDFNSAQREFRKVISSRHRKTTPLVKSVASFYAYNAERFRKENKKIRLGNAHTMDLLAGNSGDAWSDVDIAAVLVAPSNIFTNQFLASFLGRTEEAIRFQRRYAFSSPLNSWTFEPGSKYTRYTQNQRVFNRLGL